MQPLINDATSALLREIRLEFGEFQSIVFEEIRSRSWASATFTGARHALPFRLEGEGAEAAATAFLDNLEVTQFSLRDHILADIRLVSREPAATSDDNEARIRIEALTVENA